ncbi:MAG: phosphotransferase [Armatimonadota bacterium]|nr:phosphotransferase [Armatimonadota bacterium]
MSNQVPSLKSQVQSPFVSLRRHDLQQFIARVVHQGRGYQSTVYLVEKDGQRAAVKDFINTPLLFRLFVAPLLLKREIKALRHLAGVPGVPQFYGRIDRYAFAMQYVEGTPIATFSLGELPPEVFPRVQRVIDAIHAHGVAHCDLKRRSNLILTPEGEVFLIDFAAAVIGERPLHPFQNWLQKQMVEVDNKALPRLKKFVAPELLTEEDRHKLAHPTFLEKWARRLLNR